MRHTIVLAALAGALLPAGELRAQESDYAGLMLSLHAVPMALEGVGGEIFEEDGMGLGATIGYGFNDRIALYGTVDVGYIEYHPENPAAVGEDYQSLTLDLGARVNLGNELRRMRPFINAAFSGVVTEEDDELGGTVLTSGAGVTVGGGLQWFYRPRWALLFAVQVTMGAFTETEFEDEETVVYPQGIAYAHYRAQMGVTWHP